jgi:hypothetical protein
MNCHYLTACTYTVTHPPKHATALQVIRADTYTNKMGDNLGIFLGWLAFGMLSNLRKRANSLGMGLSIVVIKNKIKDFISKLEGKHLG